MIDQEKVIKGLEEMANDQWLIRHADYYSMIAEDALELLKKEPVNCSDCKHYGYNNMTNQDGFCYCIKHHEYPSPDFFCADGERR